MLDLRLNKNLYSRAVMIDRDGTINHDAGYTHLKEDLLFLEGVIDGFQLLASLPIHIIVVTNQSGIALGIYERDTMSSFHKEMVKKIEDTGGRIDAIYFAPHFDLNSLPLGHNLHYDVKPNPGMLRDAASDFMFDIHRSWMVGDRVTDVVAGKRAGAETILVDAGAHNQSESISMEERPKIVVSNLLEAARYIAKFFM